MLKISTPKSWQELKPAQLRYILTLQAQGIPSGTIQVSAFLHFAGLKIYKTEGDFLRLRAGMKVYRVKASDIAMAAMALDFITDPPTHPQLLPELSGKQAKDAELHGVPFAHYLQIENYMQQYLRTKDSTLLTPVLAMLYEGNLQEQDIDDTARYMVLHWYNGLKPFLAQTFPDLFPPSSRSRRRGARPARNYASANTRPDRRRRNEGGASPQRGHVDSTSRTQRQGPRSQRGKQNVQQEELTLC